MFLQRINNELDEVNTCRKGIAKGREMDIDMNYCKTLKLVKQMKQSKGHLE